MGLSRWILIGSVALIGAARADSSRDSLKLLDKGIALFKAGDFAAARELFAQAHDRAPDKPDPYCWLGLADARLNRCADAMFELQTFVRRVPPDDARVAEAVAVRDQCKEELH